VQLAKDPERLLVLVNYRLEVDEFTVVFDDLPALGDKIELSKFSKPQEYYEAFTTRYAPILAGNLAVRLDQQSLELTCTKHAYTLKDEAGQPLGHLRCDFVFEAAAPVSGTADLQHEFRFREGNYELEEGQIRLSLRAKPPLHVLSKIEPEGKLQETPAVRLQPGDDAKLRKLEATFTTTGGENSAEEPPPPAAKPRENAGPPEERRLLELFDSDQGVVVLLCLAALFGAAHALTPGHGKTLVAAYLVGERGTVWHALVLGLFTTLAHTGVVLAVAAVLSIFFPKAAREDLQLGLGLGGGLLVAGLGLWLLLRRLAGEVDHIHLGGHGHHHHHHHGHSHHPGEPDHWHDEHGHSHPLPATDKRVSWWGLTILGISGGIVPCWDAILMLGFAISAQRLWLALPLLLAFSAGLASVLIAIGIGVVYVKGFASSRLGERSRWVRALPIISAVLVTLMGLWLCYKSVHAAKPANAVSLNTGGFPEDDFESRRAHAFPRPHSAAPSNSPCLAFADRNR
jgi:ABC-type nickel/cobalt efflux system permease component RcnA